MRRPSSTSSGLVTFGSSSPKMIRERFSPTASAALTKSRSTTSCAAPRITRATRGACVRPTIRTISQSFGPSAETASSARMICGKASSTSLPRISTSSSQLREYAATSPTIDAEHHAEQRSRRRTSRARSGRRAGSGSSTSRPSASVPNSASLDGGLFGMRHELRRRVRREQRPEHRDEHDQQDDPHADPRARHPAARGAGCRATGASARSRGRRRAGSRSPAPRSIGAVDGLAHRAAVLSFGVTMIVEHVGEPG